jgi:signal transduction histidine kinase
MPETLFLGDSELAQRMRSLDWSATDLGTVKSWPEHWKSAIRLCLTSRIPVVMYLGPSFTVLYNDPYISFLGAAKHPRSLGRPGHEVWREIWDTIGPMLKSVYATGKATWSEDVLMFFARKLPLEEVYVRFTFGPIFAADGKTVDGIFCPCTETSEQVVGARRLETLRKLGTRAEGRSVHAACSAAAAVLAENERDIPLAAIYLAEESTGKAAFHASAGLPEEHGLPSIISPEDCEAPNASALAGALREQRVLEVPLGDLVSGLPAEEHRTAKALALPIPAAVHGTLNGLLVVGTSPRRVLDDGYRAFFDLVAGHIGSSITDAKAYEAERQRAEALAELDRAKTTFFSNVSHEFRTPLTLMLGPTEDLLVGSHGELTAAQRGQLELLHRNELRLQKLVNALLDFSRIEAGRIQASYEPLDLAGFTRDLASAFQSAVERAGLKLTVDCPPLREPVFVDREMWEKIVLNLLSNALKFTFEGEIRVSLDSTGDGVVLRVMDTGVGVPEEEVPRLFERFHRVAGSRARTHEGSGIGLALVQELVKLHGGSVHVESRVGTGTVFTVTIPKGSAHLPAERIGAGKTAMPTGLGAAPFVEEALRWLPAAEGSAAVVPFDRHFSSPDATRPRSSERILFADDNADMRDYVRRLLDPGWVVEAVEDGAKALASARARPPNLILTDVMMPGLDGFALLRELRKDERTRLIPVVMLSARAGEEARIEGLHAGADDYLIKPFSARELLARVRTQLELSRLREQRVAEIERALRFSEMFIGVLGHDLRSPLSAILTTADGLLRRETSEQFARPIRRIQSNAARMARMIEQILDFTRARIGGGIPIEPKPTSLKDLASQLVEELEPAVSRRIVLESHGDTHGEWDSDRLAQVISNLLGNAVEHGDHSQPIQLSLDGSAHDSLRIKIWNAGVIPDGLLPAVFEPFRGSRVMRNAQKSAGLGLGLYVVREIVRAHGGSIDVRSSVDAGTTFSVLIPRRTTRLPSGETSIASRRNERQGRASARDGELGGDERRD